MTGFVLFAKSTVQTVIVLVDEGRSKVNITTAIYVVTSDVNLAEALEVRWELHERVIGLWDGEVEVLELLPLSRLSLPSHLNHRSICVSWIQSHLLKGVSTVKRVLSMQGVTAAGAEVVPAWVTVNGRASFCTLRTVHYEHGTGFIDFAHLPLKDGSLKEQEGLAVELNFYVHVQATMELVGLLFWIPFTFV